MRMSGEEIEVDFNIETPQREKIKVSVIFSGNYIKKLEVDGHNQDPKTFLGRGIIKKAYNELAKRGVPGFSSLSEIYFMSDFFQQVV